MPQVTETTGMELATDAHAATGYRPELQDLHWHAIYTSPRHEKKVHEYLTYREVESFLPSYRASHRWKNGCKPLVETPLFPGYLFVKIGPQQRVRVLEIPGVLWFIGSRSEAARVSDMEIETLRSGLHLKKFAPYRDLIVGEKVRIKAGPLSGLAGVLVRTSNGPRVVLTLDLIKQSVAVELDAEDVEPVIFRRHPMIPA